MHHKIKLKLIEMAEKETYAKNRYLKDNVDLKFKRTPFFKQLLKEEGGKMRVLANALTREVYVGGNSTCKNLNEFANFANHSYDWGYECREADNFAQMLAYALWDGYTAQSHLVTHFLKTYFTAKISRKTCLTLLDIIKLEKCLKIVCKHVKRGGYPVNGYFAIEHKGRYIDFTCIWEFSIATKWFASILDFPLRSERENVREYTFGLGTVEHRLLTEMPQKTLEILKTYILSQKSQTWVNGVINEQKMDLWYKQENDEWRFTGGQGVNFCLGMPETTIAYEVE